MLAHTVSGSSWWRLRFNGVEVGETGINAALCGTWGCPVVLVTGEPEDDRRYQAELRAVGLVRKPFEPERLLNTIQDALQR